MPSRGWISCWMLEVMEIKVLPPVTMPWSERIKRRHFPPEATGKLGYAKYRLCLRWEFGFSCAFCMVHEADVSQVFGKEFMQIEHFVPKKGHEADRNRYLNCFYICRNCNNGRGVKANLSASGLRLLNPCEHVWRDAFILEGDRLVARDDDALYTETSYRMNHYKKVVVRRLRREAISESLRVLEAYEQGKSVRAIAKFLKTKDLDTRLALFEALRVFRDQLRAANAELIRWRAEPADAAKSCLCEQPSLCVLPKVLEEQTLGLDLPKL